MLPASGHYCNVLTWMLTFAKTRDAQRGELQENRRPIAMSAWVIGGGWRRVPARVSGGLSDRGHKSRDVIPVHRCNRISESI